MVLTTTPHLLKRLVELALGVLADLTRAAIPAASADFVCTFPSDLAAPLAR